MAGYQKQIPGQLQRGFTIVELLIVILVIAILATITIVAYNGIQDRARMSSAFAFEQQLHNQYGADSTGDWSFGECSGSTVRNASTGTTSTDTISGTIAWITTTPSGKGCALHFDGTTHIETSATLGATYYVKAAWVRITSPTCSSYNILSQAATNGAIAALYVPSPCQVNAGNNGAWATTASAAAVNDGKWHYIATTWINGTQTLYIDGVSVSTAASAAALQNPTGYVAIGSHGGGNFMVGDIANPFVAAR